MAEDEYDLMPHREIVKLRQEIRDLKTKRGKAPASDLQNSMDTLSKSINSLIDIFKKADTDIKAENHHDTHEHLGNMNQHLDNLNSKMEQLLKHNEEIAKGILVVAELIKNAVETPEPEQTYTPPPAQQAPMPAYIPPPVQSAPMNPPLQDYGPIPQIPRPPIKQNDIPVPSISKESHTI